MDIAASGEPTATRRTAFSSRNAEETTDFIREMYVGNRTSFHDVGPTSRFTANLAGAGAMRADRVSGDLTLHLHGNPLDYALFGQLHRGTWDLGPRRRSVVFGPGESIMYPIGAPFDLHAQHFDISVTSMPLTRLQSLAASHAGINPEDLRFHSMTAISATKARHFNATLALVHRELHDEDDPTITQPLVTDHLGQLMAAAVLSTFPNTAMTATSASSSRPAAPAALRRAVGFIDAHPDRPLNSMDIATAAGVGARALRHAFQQHLATTPIAYLRRTRLDRAHHDLRAADPTHGDTVAGVAARWGYRNPDRFAAAYRAAYGVPPSHTLRT